MEIHMCISSFLKRGYCGKIHVKFTCVTIVKCTFTLLCSRHHYLYIHQNCSSLQMVTLCISFQFQLPLNSGFPLCVWSVANIAAFFVALLRFLKTAFQEGFTSSPFLFSLEYHHQHIPELKLLLMLLQPVPWSLLGNKSSATRVPRVALLLFESPMFP